MEKISNKNKIEMIRVRINNVENTYVSHPTTELKRSLKKIVAINGIYRLEEGPLES